MKFSQDIYHLKVTCLIDSPKNPYRVIAINRNDSLEDLAVAITDSFKFGFDHCYGFFDRKNWINSKRCYEKFVDLGNMYAAMDDSQSVCKNKVKDVFDLDKTMFFMFDYGDEWLFAVRLLKKDEPELKIKYPKIIKKEGLAPKQYG